MDPLSRCAALTLPKDAIAVLPFYQSQAELDVMDTESQARYAMTLATSCYNLTRLGRDVPYSPSFILDLPVNVRENIRNVVDFVFLPGFNNPTMAVLFQTQQTWTG